MSSFSPLSNLILLGALLLCISIKSFAINYIQTECAYQITNDFDIATKKKGVYTKNVWSVIEKDQKINNVVFGPLNEVIPGLSQQIARLKKLSTETTSTWKSDFLKEKKPDHADFSNVEPKDWADVAKKFYGIQ